jgi:hypothetical protein
MGELTGKCPDCHATFWGWALENPLKQKCSKCGSTLEIRENNAPAADIPLAFSKLEIRGINEFGNLGSE